MRDLLKRLIAVTVLSGFCTYAAASGTKAGTDVTNTATLSFGDSAETATEVQSNAETFKVDKKIDLSVDTIDVAAVQTKPQATNVVLTFKVTNTGNSIQDFVLSTLTSSTKAFNDSVTDTFDAQNVRIYVDSNGNGAFDPDSDVQVDYIDELGIDESKIVFVVADMPENLQNGAAAVYDLQAQVAEGGSAGTKGAVIETDSRDEEDNKLTVQIVFADGAGSADGLHDGKYTNVDAYKIVIANMTIKKTSVVVSDPVNDTSKPKRIPGAVIRYCYMVENSGDADAAFAKITETLNTALYDMSGLSNNQVRIYTGNDVFDCATAQNLQTEANPDATGSVDANTGKVVIDLQGVPAGAKKSAYFEVTLR